MKINQLDLRWIANKQLILEFENIFLRMDIIYLYQLLPALLQRIFICNSGFLSVLGWRDSLSTYTVLLGVLTISSLICMHKYAFLVPPPYFFVHTLVEKPAQLFPYQEQA